MSLLESYWELLIDNPIVILMLTAAIIVAAAKYSGFIG